MGGTFILLVTALAVLIGYSFYVPFDPASFKGQKVVVTGASTGIGEQLAYFYAKHGANVVIIARNEKRMQNVVSKCKSLGAEDANYIKADMAATEDSYFGEVIEKSVGLLGGSLDTLVLNHVIDKGAWDQDGYYGKFDMKNIVWLYHVNLFSYVSMAQQAIPYLEKTAGRIIAVGSAAGRTGLPKVAEYSSSKHALFGYFESLRYDMRSKNSKISITTCTIGSIDTENAREGTKDSNIPDFMWYPADLCAEAIAAGGQARIYNVFYPLAQTYPVFILRSFPKVMEFVTEKFGFE